MEEMQRSSYVVRQEEMSLSHVLSRQYSLQHVVFTNLQTILSLITEKVLRSPISSHVTLFINAVSGA